MKWDAASEKPPGLWTSLRLFVSAFGAPLSRHPVPLERPPADHQPVATTSSLQPEEYEEWDDPKGGFPVTYFQVILVLGALDADHNGIISPSEIANAPIVLRGLDRNHDGKLTPDECGQGPGDSSIKGGVAEHARLEFMHFNPVLAALDADHNGEISASEIQNAPAALKALDKNGDGKLTQDEVLPDPVANAVGFVMRLDENGDGKISEDERSGELARRYRDLLDAADQNKDGIVTLEELANEIRRRAVLKGILTHEQMLKAFH
jgi:Ca2+-binding EF-hand superfamily protein